MCVCFFQRGILVFLGAFPFFSKDCRVSVGKNPCFSPESTRFPVLPSLFWGGEGENPCFFWRGKTLGHGDLARLVRTKVQK